MLVLNKDGMDLYSIHFSGIDTSLRKGFDNLCPTTGTYLSVGAHDTYICEDNFSLWRNEC